MRQHHNCTDIDGDNVFDIYNIDDENDGIINTYDTNTLNNDHY